jgi:hypothetical protein
MKATRAAIASLLILTGCSSMDKVVHRDGIEGTWAGRAGKDDAPFTFGSVSFVGDHTFTAEAKYSGNTRVTSGKWDTKGDRLSLTGGDGHRREYTYKVAGGELVVTDPKSGNSVTLDRMK